MLRYFLAHAAACVALLLCPIAVAQTTASSVQAPAGWAPMQAPCVKQLDGTCKPISAADPLPTAAASLQPATWTTGVRSTTAWQPL